MSLRARTADAQAKAAARQAASLLLGYPDETLLGLTPLVRQVVVGLPEPMRSPLLRVVDHIQAGAPEALRQDYVRTFDQRLRCCQYLTWWTHGDTRERGKSLVRVKQVYRNAGLAPPDDELPDHLAVVLEFAATCDAQAGEALLAQHRAGLELLHDALQKHRSVYADVLAAVRATLPPASAGELEAARRIAAEGPPREQVGLEPFAAGGAR